MVNAGGASTSNALRLAEQWIASGIADSVLVQQVTVFSTMPVAEQIDEFARAGIDMQWEYPYGTTYNIIMGLMATRYMYESGASVAGLLRCPQVGFQRRAQPGASLLKGFIMADRAAGVSLPQKSEQADQGTKTAVFEEVRVAHQPFQRWVVPARRGLVPVEFAVDACGQQVPLAREVPVEGRLADAGPSHHVFDAGGFEARAQEDRRGGRDETRPLAGVDKLAVLGSR